MRKPRPSFFMSALAILSAVFIASACEPPKPKSESATAEKMAGLSSRASEVAAERKLSPDDIVAALMTYTPSGRHDEYLMFASGGHGGQMIVIGI
ncbi:MAG: cytochrome C, partial [Deltaproteobacteria bacterium]|nr:cytochrome C [Deltaproteobacteria bacterium]